MGYRIFYQLADATDSPEWNNETVGASENTTAITDLRKFTNYAVQVAGFSRVGDGIVSKARFVMTDQDGKAIYIYKYILKFTAEKNELHAKNSMISETKCRK